MAKQLGLLTKLYAVLPASGLALDVSGDTANVDEASVDFGELPWTDIDQMAMDRTAGLGAGALSAKQWYDSVPANNPLQNASNLTDVMLFWFVGNAALPVEGGGSYMLRGCDLHYPLKLLPSRELSAGIKAISAQGIPGEFGIIAAFATDAGVANHATMTHADHFGAVVNITAISQANPTHVTAAAHGLITGDTILVAGSNSTPSLNGDQQVTFIDANTFSVPVNVTVAGNAGTFQRTSSHYGIDLAAFLLSIGSGSMIPILADSSDGVTFADLLTGGTLQSGAAGFRVTSSRTQTVRRYTRVHSTGTFTNANWGAQTKRGEGPLDLG